jgi:anti-anti-sigma factor
MATMQTPRAFFGRLHELPIVVLKGSVRYVMARALRSFIDDLVNQHNDTIVIDLRELEAIDSTGMGLLARLGRSTLQHGRRSVIVCDAPDVTTCLRSVAFDRLFVMLREWPFPEEPEVAEVAVQCGELGAEGLGRVMLEAHRELASLSETNRDVFGAVVSTLQGALEPDGSEEAGTKGKARSDH